MNDIVITKNKLGYILIFIHPNSNDFVYLANSADIQSICYSDRPYLPGTKNPNFAKFYLTANDAKADVYLLRYHHREFLNIPIIIKSAAHLEIKKDNNQIAQNDNVYYLDECSQTWIANGE